MSRAAVATRIFRGDKVARLRYAAATAQRSGAGGLACPGEAAAEAAGRISRVIPDPSAFGGKRVAVLGGGYSAVTTVKLLADAEAAPSAITWLVRAAETRRPYARVDNDPLPQRDALAKFGNGLAGVGTSGTLSCVRGAELERVRTTATGLELALGDGRVVPCDHLVSLTGYRPDAALYRELHVRRPGGIPNAARLIEHGRARRCTSATRPTGR